MATRVAIVKTHARRWRPCSSRSYARSALQERLLPRVLRALPEQPAQVAEHLVAMLDVEALERRDVRCRHDRAIMGETCQPLSRCEMRRRRTRRVGRVHRRRRRCRRRGTSPIRPTRGRCRPAAAASWRCRWRGSTARATSSPALGDDELGHRAVEELTARGVTAPRRSGSTRRRGARSPTSTQRGERTITIDRAEAAPARAAAARGHGHDLLRRRRRRGAALGARRALPRRDDARG